jgi:3-phenylpropionate/trans-cinnamate dioxygenase ferredoxin reductase subunit
MTGETTMTSTVVIVGAGRCGASAAETLRAEGFDGRVVLVGEEDDLPYNRPPLSKEYLRGEQDDDGVLVQPRAWYDGAGIDLRTGSAAVALDCRSRTVRLAGGEVIHFDRLLLATGGRPRTLPHELERVRYLRTLADAKRLRTELAAARHVVIVGAGFIGAETAASARELGVEVTILEALDVPLAAAFGAEVGAVYADLHRSHGVRLHTGEGLASVTESAEGWLRVHTTRGHDVDCDLVVVGIGIVPRAELARAAGIKVDNGVLVDEFCRTSVPGVFAAGDVANHFHPLVGRHIRVEHDDNAVRQGAAAARAMLGQQTAYDDPHWFWSDQYGASLQYVGHCLRWDQLVVRGSLAELQFTAFYVNNGMVEAALAVNRPKDIIRARKLIRARKQVAVDLLADAGVDLRAV